MASLSSVVRSTALAVVTTLACAPAFAAVVFTSQSAFLAATRPGAYTENFNNNLGPQFATSFSFAGGAFGYTVTAAPLFGNQDDTYLSGTFVGNAYSTAELIVNFTSGSPTAIGGNFFLTDSIDGFSAGPITISLSDGTNVTINPSSAADFTGFTSTVAITSLTMAITAAGQFNTIDNLVVGRAAVVVPEPATCALLAGGLMALALTKRRRRS